MKIIKLLRILSILKMEMQVLRFKINLNKLRLMLYLLRQMNNYKLIKLYCLVYIQYHINITNFCSLKQVEFRKEPLSETIFNNFTILIKIKKILDH